MQPFTTLLLSMLLSISASSAFAPSLIPVGEWEASIGDRFLVDTKENIGYLVHTDGSYTAFPVVTGQRRVVRYIGLTYDATTPESVWVARSKHVQPDRITYGQSGKFLRLYEGGEEWSHYGIHTHLYGAEMLGREDRFGSMGCVIVSDEVYDILEKTFEIQMGHLVVVTKYGVAL